MWSASIQRELKYNTLVEVAYLSNNSKHEIDHQYINALRTDVLALGAQTLLQPLNSAGVQSLSGRPVDAHAV